MKSIYWNVNNIITKQRHINFILGERGVGKTFTTLEWCVNRALKYGEEFVYMRRYESELNTVKDLLSPLSKYSEKFKDCIFTVKGNEFFCDGKRIGHWIALSTSNHLKGTAFPDVKYLIYDEFLAEAGVTRELKKEMHKFYNVLETLFRNRDFMVFMLANTTSFQCCYRTEMNLNLPFDGNEFWYHKKKSILVQLVHNEPYREAKMASPLGKIIEGTTYAEYAVKNNFYIDSYSFVKKRSGTHHEILNFVYKNKKYGLYVSRKEKSMVIDISRSSNLDFQIRDFDMTDEGVKLLSKSSHPVFRYMRNYYDVSQLFYQNLDIKSELYPFLFKIL